MNTSYMAFNLEEASKELSSILNHIKNDEEYTEDDLRDGMEHLYHHINFAWNTRHTSNKEVEELDERQFDLWRKFPQDITL